MAKIQTLKINGEVVYPRTIKQAIVDLQGTPTIITNDGTDGDALAIKLTENGSYQRTFRIDMTGVYTGGEVIQRIGSLIIECFAQGDDVCHGYYYGDTLSDILTEVAVYQDDQDSGIFYLMLTHESSLDSVTFAITPTDDVEVDAIITNAADDHTKVDDANITTVGSGGGDGKYGVVSQTLTRTNSYEWVVAPQTQAWGMIPNYFIELVTHNAPPGVAGKVDFNEQTGYFELNGLSDIAYDEMMLIYQSLNLGNEILTGKTAANNTTDTRVGTVNARTNMTRVYVDYNFASSIYAYISNGFTSCFQSIIRITNGDMVCIGGALNAFVLSRSLKTILPVLDVSLLTQSGYYGNSLNGAFNATILLESVYLKGLKTGVSFSQSPNLTTSSIAYMVENVGVSTAITITLHATAYARATADASVQAALQSKTNVSLASA